MHRAESLGSALRSSVLTLGVGGGAPGLLSLLLSSSLRPAVTTGRRS